MRKTVEVQMDAGMEARPIALMVQTANQFPVIFIWRWTGNMSMQKASWE